jgi:hypothetical protein
MGEKTAVVATTTDYLLAHVWCDLLESAGIPAEVFGESIGAVYPGLPLLATLSVAVHTNDALRAHALLAEMELENRSVDEP